MPFLGRLRFIALGTLLWTSASVPARAAGHANTAPTRAAGSDATTAATRKHAAQLYDQAVGLYDKGKYAEAARAFYDADALAPSSDALSSAIAAARLANDHLLVAQAAQRAIARESSDAKLAGDARAALSEAESHLARVDLTCRPEPCELSVEGAPALPGRQYLLPGTHLLVATFTASGEHVEQRASLAAGSLYTITLAPSPPSPPSPPNTADKPAKGAPSQAAQPTQAPSAKLGESQPRAAKPLPSWTFFTAAGVSVALGGVTIWSGIDALSDADHFKQTRTSGDRASAVSSVHRTDLLLAGTAVLTGLTILGGLSLVDFGSHGQAVGIAPERGGALVTWSGRM